MENDKLIISPKTKVMQLIEAYPELEEILIDYVPAFKKLKNPVLRKTIAKVATLQQAASIGKVKIETLINHLRKEVGQDSISDLSESKYNTEKPAWFNTILISAEFDAEEMLSVGEHPVNHIISELKKMKSGNIYKLIVPFLPAPLIDKATSIGFKHWIVEENNGKHHIYFCKEDK